MPIHHFTFALIALLGLLLAGDTAAASTFRYTDYRVEAIMRKILPQQQFDVIAVDTKDAPAITALYRAYPKKRETLQFLATQSAGAFHVPAAKRPGRNTRAACYMFYAARNNESHQRIRMMTNLDDDKVMHIIVSHEVSHCQVHALMDRSLANVRTGGHDLSWFPAGLHYKLKNAAIGSDAITKQDMAVVQFQRWTETLVDMFAINSLWQSGYLSEQDINKYLRFRASDEARDPEHATAGGLRRLYAMLMALDNNIVAEKAYRAMPAEKQQQLLLGMLTEEVNGW